MPLFVHAMLGAFAVHGQAVQLPAQTYREIADVDHFLDFAQPFGADFAHFEGDKFTQRLFVFTEQITQITDHFTTFGGWYITPSGKCSLSSGHGGVVAGYISRLNIGNDFASRRVIAGNPFAAGLEPFGAATGAKITFSQI